MKIQVFILSLLLFASFTSVRKKKKPTGQCTISVTRTSAYCGGMRPSEEQLKNLSTPVALPNKKLFIKKGEENSMAAATVLTIETDEKGMASFSLAPGKYCIVDDRKNDSTYFKSLLTKYAVETENFSAIDAKCLSNWVKQPDMIIEVVAKKKNEFTINYHTPCFYKAIPCCTYKGPLPK